MEKIGEETYTPSRSYKLSLTIKDRSLTNDLTEVRVVSAIAGAYQIVILELSLDPNDMILENIFGKDPLKLKIELIGRGLEVIPSESISMELMYLDSDFDMPMLSGQAESKEKMRVPILITTIPIKPFEAMSKIVNKIFINKTPTEVVTALVAETGCELVMDSDGKNQNKITQIMIPCTSLYKAIQFLDDNFGLYEGACNLGFCQYDNKFYVMNLTKRMTKAQTFTITHLATTSDDTNKTIEKSTDGKNFYTYNELTSNYSGNAVFASLAKKSNIIFKPENDLSGIKTFDLKKICAEYGAISKNTDIDFDPSLENRETYVTTDTGYGEGNVSVANIARKIIGLATVNFVVEKDLPILNLVKVGEPVKLVTKTVEYIPLSGMYLLKSSDIVFKRPHADWQTTCYVTLMRTNKSI